MLDIKFIRENKELIAAGAVKKHIDFDVESLLSVDDKRRALTTEIEKKRAEQNAVSDSIVKVSDQTEREKLISEMKILKETLQKEEEELRAVMLDWQRLMLAVPNIPDMSVPDGDSDKDNKEVKKWGTLPQFDFTPKNHAE